MFGLEDNPLFDLRAVYIVSSVAEVLNVEGVDV